MKKLLIFSFVLISLVLEVNAQNKDFEKELYIGFGGGATFSSIDFAPSVLQGTIIGAHGGMAIKYITEKNIGLQLEINYAQKGWKEEFDPESDFAYSRRLHYVEIPFMTHVYFGNSVRFNFNAGPQIGFLIGDKATNNRSFSDYINKISQEDPTSKFIKQYVEPLKTFDYGLTGGVGMELKTGVGNLVFDGRYYFGLGDIMENRKLKDSYFNRSASRVIEGKITYFFKVR